MKSLYRPLLFIIQLLAVASGYAATPLLTFRNDGQFDAFDSDEIERISFSKYDLDSIKHDTFVVQDIWTGGGVVRIPISSIERVSLVPPKTVIKEGALLLDNNLLSHLKHVENETTLYFDETVAKIPGFKTGAKIVTTETSELLPIGFIGEITEIASESGEVAAKCKRIKLTDVYESLYLCTEADSKSEEPKENRIAETAQNQQHKISAEINREFSLPVMHKTIGLDGSFEVSDVIDIGTSSALDIEIAPKLHFKNYTVIERGRLDTSTSLTCDLFLKEDFSHSLNGTLEKDFSLPAFSPVGLGPFLKLFVKGGIKVSLSGAYGLNVGFDQHYRLFAATSYSSSKETSDLSRELSFKLIDSNHQATSSYGEATIQFGPYLQFGVAAITPQLANVNIEVAAGAQINANAKVSVESLRNASKSPELYKSLSNPEAISAGLFRESSLNAEILDGLCSTSIVLDSEYRPLWSSPVLPIINKIQAKRRAEDLTAIDAEGEYTPGLIANESVSFGLLASDDTDFDNMRKNFSVNHTVSEDSKKHNITSFIFDVDFAKKYDIYPIVAMGDYTLLAQPSETVDKDECKINSVRQTEAKVVSDKEVLIDFDINTSSDSNNWGIDIVTVNQTTPSAIQIKEGNNTSHAKIILNHQKIDYPKWPYRYTKECKFIPQASVYGIPTHMDTAAKTAMIDFTYMPTEYYVVGDFPNNGWTPEKGQKMTAIGNNRFQTTIPAEPKPKPQKGYYDVNLKILPNVAGVVDWVHNFGGANGILEEGGTNIVLSGKGSYVITIDMNNLTYSVY